MDTESPSFEALERRIAEYSPPVPLIDPSRGQRLPLLMGLISFGVALLAQHIIPGVIGVVVSAVAAIAEVVFFSVFLVNALRVELPQFVDAKRKFAVELEGDYEKYLGLIAWLKRFPTQELRSRLGYIRRRRDSMGDRFWLVTGGVHRLGVLPVAIALYLQFKNGIEPVGLWQGLLAILLMLLYVGSWWLVGFKLRLDLYVRVLEDAVPRQFQEP